MDYTHFLDIARSAALEAEERILHYYVGTLEIEIKADLTPVTVADQEAERIIRQRLSDAFPGHGIIGEEYGSQSAGSEYRWLIDPIDGTKSFVGGFGMFSTQIALMHGDQIIVGVSNAPAMGELAWATRGGGAWLNGEALQVSTQETIEGASLSTGNIGSLARSPRWQALGTILACAGRTRGYGDYYHYHRLAAGQLDAVIESEVNILDIAAVSLIVSEAGGVFTDLDGNPVGDDTRSVLAAPGRLHGRLLSVLNEAR